jgi:ABC-type glutathione transport system ATPase component
MGSRVRPQDAAESRRPSKGFWPHRTSLPFQARDGSGAPLRSVPHSSCHQRSGLIRARPHLRSLASARRSAPGRILTEIDLTISGSLLAALGPSGSRKTTLLRLICVERNDRGSIAIGDVVMSGPGVQLPLERRHVGYVAQDGALSATSWSPTISPSARPGGGRVCLIHPRLTVAIPPA